MSITAQKEQDALLALLETNDTAKPVRRRQQFRGTSKSDIYSGTSQADTASGGSSDDFLKGNNGNDRLNGGNADDLLYGGAGNDRLNGGSGKDFLFGQLGNDQLNGGAGDDVLDGGAGNDALVGGTGNDLMVGGTGVDRLRGGSGRDQFGFDGDVFANGTTNLAAGPNINVLNQPDLIRDFSIADDRFIFDADDLNIDSLDFQKGVSSQLANGNVLVLTDGFAAAGAAARAIANNNNITADEGVFAYFNTTLGITRLVYSEDLGDGGDISVLANLENQKSVANQANFTAANFELNGGNSATPSLRGTTLIGDLAANQLTGGAGDDLLDGRAGNDTLTGGNGRDQITGGDGVDALTGGNGGDRFKYDGNAFANGTPTLAAAPNINVLNQPDAISDFTIAEDQFAFDISDLGITGPLTFQKGASSQLANGNVLVLTDGFAAAGAAARAIANNNNITADAGVFAYFNTTLGITRLVYSEDLSDGGDISVLANLNNQKSVANQANFTAANFSFT